MEMQDLSGELPFKDEEVQTDSPCCDKRLGEMEIQIQLLRAKLEDAKVQCLFFKQKCRETEEENYQLKQKIERKKFRAGNLSKEKIKYFTGEFTHVC